MSSISCDCAMALLRMTPMARSTIAAIVLARGQQVRPAEDGVERRAQLVRQRGEELVLQAVDGLGVRAGALLAFEQRQALRFDPLPFVDLVAERGVRLGELAGPGADAVLQLLVRQQQRLRLALERFALLVQLDEDRDLGLQDLRAERLEDVVDGADRIAAEDLRVAAVVRGQEDDRRLRGCARGCGSVRRSRSRRGRASRRRAGSARSRSAAPPSARRGRTRRAPRLNEGSTRIASSASRFSS